MGIMEMAEMAAEDQGVVPLLAGITRAPQAMATPMATARMEDIAITNATKVMETATAAEGALNTVTMAKEEDATAVHIVREMAIQTAPTGVRNIQIIEVAKVEAGIKDGSLNVAQTIKAARRAHHQVFHQETSIHLRQQSTPTPAAWHHHHHHGATRWPSQQLIAVSRQALQQQAYLRSK